MASKEDKAKNASRTLTILLTRGPYLTDSADLAVNTALAARRAGYAVNLFLYMDGVWLSHVTTDKDFENAGELLRWCVKKGASVAQCESCSKARDVREGDMVEGVKISAVYTTLTQMLAQSDRVLTFMG